MKLIAKEKIIVEFWDGKVDGALAQVRYELSINYELKGGVWSRNHIIFMSALKKFKFIKEPDQPDLSKNWIKKFQFDPESKSNEPFRRYPTAKF